MPRPERPVRGGAVAVALLVFVAAAPHTSVVAVAAGRARRAHPRVSATPHPRAPAGARIARYRVTDGSVVDLGWTGIAHRQPWSTEQRIEFALECASDGQCSVGGGSAGTIFGAPVPISAGGVPVCTVSRLRAPLAGRVVATTGCGELRLALTTTVYTADDVARPCPLCVGDRVANDGRKDGRCDRGAGAGAACDANAASTRFGATSNDCLPAPASTAGSLSIDLAPLSTGYVELAAEHDCGQHHGARCFCPAQAAPNECDDGVCAPDERCEAPVDGVCNRAPYRTCMPEKGRGDCEELVPGTGTCEPHRRQCFGDRIVATGACDPVHPTYVAIFCAPATHAPAINSTAGLPGPARLRLALEAVTPASAHAATAR